MNFELCNIVAICVCMCVRASVEFNTLMNP